MRLRKWRSERGSVLVEFAMVLPIFLLITWCIVDFARAFYTANSLAAAVRDGARAASARQDPTDATTVAEIKARVQSSFNTFGGAPIPTDSIFVDASSGSEVTVTVRNYNWLTTTPINLFSGGVIRMTKSATFRWELDTTGL